MMIPVSLLSVAAASSTVQTIEFNSSVLASGSYDSSSQTMTLKFKNGKTHDYRNVEPRVFEGLATSTSVGSYYNSNIKGRY